jgi:ATP-dependent helicase HrpB
MASVPLHPRLAKLVLEAIARRAGQDACAAAAFLSAGARPSSCELITALDAEWDPRTRQHFEQIRRIVRPLRAANRNHDALAISILTAFPDRVARRRRDNQVLLATGGPALLADPAHVAEFFVALDVEDRSENALPLIRLTSGIQPAWLIDLFPDRIQERTSVEWNRTAERSGSGQRTGVRKPDD